MRGFIRAYWLCMLGKWVKPSELDVAGWVGAVLGWVVCAVLGTLVLPTLLFLGIWFGGTWIHDSSPVGRAIVELMVSTAIAGLGGVLLWFGGRFSAMCLGDRQVSGLLQLPTRALASALRKRGMEEGRAIGISARSLSTLVAAVGVVWLQVGHGEFKAAVLGVAFLVFVLGVWGRTDE